MTQKYDLRGNLIFESVDNDGDGKADEETQYNYECLEPLYEILSWRGFRRKSED